MKRCTARTFDAHAFIGALIFILCAGSAMALDAQVSAGLDNNPMLSRKPGDQVPVWTAEGSLYHSQFFELSPRLAWSVLGAVDARWFDTTSSLSEIALDTAATGYFQPRLGYTAPWYQLAVSATPVLVANEQRNHVQARLRVSRHQRLTDRLNYALGLQASQSFADERIFRQRRYGLDGQINFDRRLARPHGFSGVFLRGGVQQGQFASTRSYQPSGVYGYNIMIDDGLSDDLGSTWWVYRTDALAFSAVLGARYNLSPRWALDTSLQHDQLNSDVGDYSRQKLVLSLVGRLGMP
ncbi:hypothetical protein NFC81_00550 [Salinispirillum sp. LH 10-3-1]|uniref:DUF2490 domain-containing protein n=1 Tax=Salinispirillum sp. LH 10-3-1 TaxID=2952525 RepID=A0AB38YG69_9GAMM